MNPVLILARNNLELTKKALASIQAQDIPTDILLIDNDSTDGTLNWAQDNLSHVVCFRPQLGVSAGWNWGLSYIFGDPGNNHCLVINNDVELPPWFYSTLLQWFHYIRGPELSPEDVGFITGSSTDSRDLLRPKEPHPPVPHPDFSAFLMNRNVWRALGPFDERMKYYAQDNDYHVRAYRAGIRMENSGVPFYHERSSTLNNAMPEERAEIQRQANADREVFKSLYGCMPWEPAYQELFK